MFGFNVLRTWEFNTSNPLRSIFIPQVLLTPSFLFGSWLTSFVPSALSVYFLVLLPRLSMTVLSLFGDCLMYNLARHHTSVPDLVMSVYTSSYIVFVYFTRTLSNTTEAFLFTSLLYFTTLKADQIVENPPSLIKFLLKNECVLLISSILSLGLFNRPTFLLFALMPYVHWLFSKHNAPFVVCRLFLTCLYGGMFSLFIILWDTAYYKQVIISIHVCNAFMSLLSNGSGFVLEFCDQFVITPLNFIRYNTNPSNLAQHGSHAAYQHMLVNIPLLLGPMSFVIFAKLVILVNSGSRWPHKIGIFLSTAMLPVVVLSWFSHQEPRFLIPIIVPVSILVGLFQLNSRMFYVIWVLFNLLCCLFYGILHQGGLLPSLTHIRQHIHTSPPFSSHHIIFYHTYMPPTYVLAHSTNLPRKLQIQDLKGANKQQLSEAILTANIQCSSCYIYIIAPSSKEDDVCTVAREHSSRAHLLHSSSYHLSMEELPDVISNVCMNQSKRASYQSGQCSPVINNGETVLSCIIHYSKLNTWVYDKPSVLQS